MITINVNHHKHNNIDNDGDDNDNDNDDANDDDDNNNDDYNDGLTIGRRSRAANVAETLTPSQLEHLKMCLLNELAILGDQILIRCVMNG